MIGIGSGGEGSITVSREALRAELLSLELRLIEKLVSKQELEALSSQVSHIDLVLQTKADRGDVASRREINEMIRKARETEQAHTWSLRENWATVMLTLIALASLAVALWVAVHGYHKG